MRIEEEKKEEALVVMAEERKVIDQAMPAGPASAAVVNFHRRTEGEQLVVVIDESKDSLPGLQQLL